jgi:hypothetical protein
VAVATTAAVVALVDLEDLLAALVVDIRDTYLLIGYYRLYSGLNLWYPHPGTTSGARVVGSQRQRQHQKLS